MSATDHLAGLIDRASALRLDAAPVRTGALVSYDGLLMQATGIAVPVGTVCRVGEHGTEAEVIGFRGDTCMLMALGDRAELVPGARVEPVSNQTMIAVGPGLLGRVIDGNGRPLDGQGPVRAEHRWPLTGRQQNPLERARITEPMDVGVRAIIGLLTVGQGQRVGIIAGSGVG